jgi:hypothetical protein
MIIKFTGVGIVASLLVQSFAPGCLANDHKVCDTLAEVHAHNEIPTGGDRITVRNSMAASGSNGRGMSFVKLAANVQ